MSNFYSLSVCPYPTAMSGATNELSGSEHMDRAYGSQVLPLPSFNGLKSVVTISAEATPLGASRFDTGRRNASSFEQMY